MKEFTEAKAKQLDQEDPLKRFREEFIVADPSLVYLDGNSLGRLPAGVEATVVKEIRHAWGDRLIRSWNEGWYTLSSELGDKIAEIAGARPGEVIVTDSTSVNLYKLAHAALKFQHGRKKVITDDLNFPSDIYILQGLVKAMGPEYELVVLSSEDGMTMDPSRLETLLDEDTALVSLSHVVFKSAFRYPMKEVTKMVQDAGALMLWDLSHSIGAVPGELNASHADLAVGCTYKYLNGGPGAPAFLYVRDDLQEKLESPVWGWFGEADPFEFGLDYRPAQGIRRFLAGTPPVLSLAPLKRSLELLNDAGMDHVREKSVKQSTWLLDLADAFLLPNGFSVGSPRDAEKRGSHVTLQHPEAYRICKAMISDEAGGQVIIPDFREPDNIRLGITPLYTTFTEIFQAVMQMKEIVENGLYRNFPEEKDAVT